MRHNPKTASKLLAEYEALNMDLPKHLRRQMAAFVLVYKVGIDALEELYQCFLGQTPARHRSWLWYTAMRTSGLDSYWDKFAKIHNTPGRSLQEALDWLKSVATKEEWKLLSCRLGLKENLYPSSHPRKTKLTYWTRGGVWRRDSNLTKIIVLGQHIPRDYDFNTISKALGPQGAHALESELYAFIDEESLLFPDAVKEAVAYTRQRMPELANRKRICSYQMASWFFQALIPGKSGARFVTYKDPMCRYSRRQVSSATGRTRTWEWIPRARD